MKTCTKCRKVLPETAYAPNRRGRGGLNAQCRKCVSAYNKVWNERKKQKKGKA
jgi:hypothetical protein